MGRGDGDCAEGEDESCSEEELRSVEEVTMLAEAVPDSGGEVRSGASDDGGTVAGEVAAEAGESAIACPRRVRAIDAAEMSKNKAAAMVHRSRR